MKKEKGLEWAPTTHLVFLDTNKLHDADVEVPQASLAPVCHHKHEQEAVVSHNNNTAARKSEKQSSKNILFQASLVWPDPVEMRQGLSNDDPAPLQLTQPFGFGPGRKLKETESQREGEADSTIKPPSNFFIRLKYTTILA